MELRGLFRLLFLYDVAESIDLEKLRGLLGERGGSAGPSFPRRTPDMSASSSPSAWAWRITAGLVDETLHTFGELYDSMTDRYNEARSFVLEVLVTILAVLDVILLFRGR